mmetsp:Transcript_15465/g.45616  ORF Transcript_15465/g.45616 Transcript_15465/m.45616 type:complete len:272 (+) Transcript_15465:255-1070(+)
MHAARHSRCGYTRATTRMAQPTAPAPGAAAVRAPPKRRALARAAMAAGHCAVTEEPRAGCCLPGACRCPRRRATPARSAAHTTGTEKVSALAWRCGGIGGAGRTVARALQQERQQAVAPGLELEPWTGSPAQQQALEDLRNRMASCPDGQADEETLIWYLRDRSYDVEEAAEKLGRMLSWRRGFGPGGVTEAQVAKEAATGKSRVHTAADVFGRPAIIITAKKHIIGEFSMDDSKRLCVHMLDKAISYLPTGPGSGGAAAALRSVGLRLWL